MHHISLSDTYTLLVFFPRRLTPSMLVHYAGSASTYPLIYTSPWMMHSWKSQFWQCSHLYPYPSHTAQHHVVDYLFLSCLCKYTTQSQIVQPPCCLFCNSTFYWSFQDMQMQNLQWWEVAPSLQESTTRSVNVYPELVHTADRTCERMQSRCCMLHIMA